MSRQAKMLANKRLGRSQPYGLVLEELMKSRGQSFDMTAARIPGNEPNESEKPKEETPVKSKGKVAKKSPTVNAAAHNLQTQFSADDSA
jgi:hypothetical protein